MQADVIELIKQTITNLASRLDENRKKKQNIDDITKV